MVAILMYGTKTVNFVVFNKNILSINYWFFDILISCQSEYLLRTITKITPRLLIESSIGWPEKECKQFKIHVY